MDIFLIAHVKVLMHVNSIIRSMNPIQFHMKQYMAQEIHFSDLQTNQNCTMDALIEISVPKKNIMRNNFV